MDKVKAACPSYLSTTQFCNLLIHQELERRTGRIDNLTPSPLTIPLSPLSKSLTRVEIESEGVESNERQRVDLVGGEREREGEIKSPLETPQPSPNRNEISRDFKPAASHPWRTDDLNIGRNVIPEILADFEQQIRDFWKVKKGSKNTTAWARQMTQLIAILKKHGARALGEQLDEAALKGTWQAITLKNYEQWGQANKKPWEQEPESKHPAFKDAREIIKERGKEWDIPSATGGRGVLDFDASPF